MRRSPAGAEKGNGARVIYFNRLSNGEMEGNNILAIPEGEEIAC